MHVKHTQPQTGGFTLIEVLVSLAIFTIVVTMSVGALMTIIGADAKERNLQSIMTNLTFALDEMTRDIRTGSDYFCGAAVDLPTDGTATLNCESGGEAFAFNEGGESLTKNASSPRIAFKVDNGVLKRRLGNGSWEPMTSPNIRLTDVRFYVSGATRGDAESPTMTLFMKGTAGDNNDPAQSEFNIETTVVQQLLDI